MLFYLLLYLLFVRSYRTSWQQQQQLFSFQTGLQPGQRLMVIHFSMIVLLIEPLYVVIVIAHAQLRVNHTNDVLNILGSQSELFCQINDIIRMRLVHTAHKCRNRVSPRMLQMIVVYVVIDNIKNGVEVIVIVTLAHQIVNNELSVQITSSLAHAVKRAVENDFTLSVTQANDFLGKSEGQLVVVMRMKVDGNILCKIMIHQRVDTVNVVNVHGTIGVDYAKAIGVNLIDQFQQFQQFFIAVPQGVNSLNEQHIAFLLDSFQATDDVILLTVKAFLCKTYSDTVNRRTIERLHRFEIVKFVIDKSYKLGRCVFSDKRAYLVNVSKERAVALVVHLGCVTKEPHLNDVNLRRCQPGSNVLGLCIGESTVNDASTITQGAV